MEYHTVERERKRIRDTALSDQYLSVGDPGRPRDCPHAAVRAASSERRNPQPRSTVRIAQSRAPSSQWHLGIQ